MMPSTIVCFRQPGLFVLVLGAALLASSCARVGFGGEDGSVLSSPDATAVEAGGDLSPRPDGRRPDGGPDAAIPDAAAIDGGVAPLGQVITAQRFGGSGDEQGYDVTIDPGGNVILVGTFQTQLAFGGKTVVGSSQDDAFVAAFSPGGMSLWALAIRGAGNNRAQGVTTDAQGNVYVCGLFSGSTSFGGATRVSAGASADLFVASYTKGGIFRWVATAGEGSWDFAYDVAVAPDGDVLLTGYITGAVNFGSGPLPSKGGRDVFLARYSPSGTLRWARSFGSSGLDVGYAVDTDSAGNIVLGGSYAASINIGGANVGAAPGGSLVAKLNPSGTGAMWVRPTARTVLWDLAVHRPSGEIRVASRVQSGADLGAGPITPKGSSDALVMALDAGGKRRWHQIVGGALSDIGLGMAVDAAGNSFMIGLGGANIDFGAGTVQGHGDQDILIVSHDPTGKLRWGKLFGGTAQDRGYGIALSPRGTLYATGRFAAQARFDGVVRDSAAGDDLFLLELK
jgi:hypothetical protein